MTSEALGRVLVAGATGHLGSCIMAELRRGRVCTRALVRREEQRTTVSADDVFVGQVTDPRSLRHVADDVDTVISTIGVTRQRDGVGYEQVDYAGNLALLREAEAAGASRFVYVSVLHGETLRRRVRLVAAKERFVDELTASPLRPTVIRPAGFFFDMGEFPRMAQHGRAFLIGDGRNFINPISGPDLATACLEAAAVGVAERAVGGPDVYSYEDVAKLAFYVADRRPRIVHVPRRLARAAIAAASAVTPEPVYGPAQFLCAVLTENMVASPFGDDHLEDYFRAQHRPPG
ncbi:NAD(P)H-binding protein [Leifsonia sp. NCR5]|uniref:NAD(P)H-binding protein n=1 Tax=Leifsonia sp. NCR5 TaxID=1978342 RepID=UPI000A18B4BF|nr:NAD(P)H-binding protein [Leifsonia sp. NCR5]